MSCGRIVLASLVACTLCESIPSAGQTVGTAAAAITGKVTDTTGAVLTGVTVTISSEAIIGNQGERKVVTGDDGLYRFAALPPGEYSVLFVLEGFKAVSREGVHVGVGFNAMVNVELEIAALNQSVTVERKSPVIDTQSTAITTRFDARELANLPGSRSMFAILSATPAVTVGHFEVGGGSGDSETPYGAYGTRSANRPMVEGINVAGIFPSGFTLDFGSFDEVSVGTAVHSAEWPLPGVQMQFISKSGGNRYRGTLYADYEHHDWQSFNIDESQITRGARAGNGEASSEANRVWSYHDVNGDLGGYIKQDKLWWYSSFRDQDVAARQVNFPVRPRRTHLMNYTAKGTYQITPRNNVVVYGQAGWNHQPNLVTGFSVAPTAAISLSEDSTAELLASGRIWKGEWNSIVNQHLFVEVRAGEFATSRHEKPNGTAPRFEDTESGVVEGGNRDWKENRRSDQAFGSVSSFKDGWLGSHHLKIGGETLRTTVTDTWNKGYPGDVLHVLHDGNPAEVYLFQTPSTSENGLQTYGVYAIDSWRFNGRLTMSPGLRFDRYRVFLPEQIHPSGLFSPTVQRFPAVDNLIHWNHLAPRIGAIYDVGGDGTTLLKFNYGQYWFGPGLNVGTNANPNSSDWWQQYSWPSDLNHSGVWEPGEEGAPLGARGGRALESPAPDLQLPIMREVAAAVERELFANVGIRTGLVWRGERQHYVRQNANRPFNAFTVPVVIQDPGPDGKVGTEDDGPAIAGYDITPETKKLPQLNIVRNVPDADSHYLTWDITATRRFSKGWSLVAGFAHTWNYDQANAYSGQPVRQNTYPLTPNDLINAGGDGEYDFRIWSAKIYGTYEAPWGLRITPYLRHQSGQPFGRTFSQTLNYGTIRILAEPIDTRRMDNITLLDVRIEKGFRLAEGRRLAGFIDGFNLLNANPAETAIWTSGTSFLRPLSIVAPRIVRIGTKLEW